MLHQVGSPGAGNSLKWQLPLFAQPRREFFSYNVAKGIGIKLLEMGEEQDDNYRRGDRQSEKTFTLYTK